MKKLLIIILVLSFSYHLISQQHSIGIIGGLNFSNITSKDYFKDSKVKLGFTGGIKYELLLSKKFLLGADLLYNQQGFVEPITFTDLYGNPTSEYKMKSSFDYISLPLKFGYVFGDKFKIAPKAGLQTSYLLSAKVTGALFDTNGKVIGEKVEVITDNVSKIDMAVLLETEFSYGLSENLHVFTTLFGKYGLTNLMDNGNAKLYAFGALFGLKYSIKKINRL